MRVFLALISEQLQSSVVDQLVQQADWNNHHIPEDRHMTLMFLGEQSSDVINEVKQALNHLLADRVVSCVSWQASYVGDFPINKPKVWALQGELSLDLHNMAKLIHRVMHDAGCKSNLGYEFIPHVTLSYIKQGSGLELPVDMLFQFDQLVLCRSLTEQERAQKPQVGGWAKARYEVLARWHLE